jgi:phosphate transport system permease protein
VVLGFLAALVFAPFVDKGLLNVLVLFFTLPVCMILGAHVWQLLPGTFTRPLSNWRPMIILIPILLGLGLAFLLGPSLELLFFGGDFKEWLAWEPGGGGPEEQTSTTGGWMLMILPLSILLVVFLAHRLITPWLRRVTAPMERSSVAWLDLARFAVLALITLGLALVISTLLSELGIDPRSDWRFLAMDLSPLDVYVQRNALIVGFVMGFAIIPIIYTIADDALSSVPEHLRSASLGAGATPWQTAIRIVIPTAMSGLFSALMVGLGRAVGETMIVLMALGNTAIMDWNIFNGARTLSANIAVELPEAVRNSSHYRTLFLAALVLFAMTFVVNTVAEMVRLRFRKRAYQL